ncbi:hypothetical protein [Neptunicoccus cionae]|uniref:hypothetical protein n=1 Tax=Neptunicoccus cionae TaxID=2035344 RepID=UPI003570FB00
MQKLAALPVLHKPLLTSVGMVTRRNRHQSPLLHAFAAHMRDYVENDLRGSFKL